MRRNGADAKEFLGFRRPDGRVGTRNHVAIVSVMDNVNPLVRRVCQNIRGCIAVCPSHGRGEVGRDLDQHLRTLSGLVSNPNVYGSILVGLEPTMPRMVADRAAQAGKPIETLSVDEKGGTSNTMAVGMHLARNLVVDASMLRRDSAQIGELAIGLECGGSDATSGVAGNPALGVVADRIVEAGGTVVLSETSEWMGAEHILARRAVSPQVGREIIEAVRWYEEYARSIGINVSENNPAPDNKRGGLTTIEEKSLGAIKKGGSSPVRALIRYADPLPTRGLILMDGSSPGTENVTGLAATGVQLIVFITGKGNPIASPVVPTIKVTGNPRTMAVASENIDVDVSGVITQGLSLSEAGDHLYSRLLDHANGKMTAAEVSGEEETAIMRIGFSL